MKKSIKLLAVLSFLIYILSSCLSSESEDSRTAEMEQSEINTALSNLENEGFDIDTTASGMYYVVHVAGEGPTVQEGDTCYLRYAGYFLDGTVFDASEYYYEDGIWELVHGEVSLIPGFKEAIGMLNKGAEVDFIIPSALAYGAAGVTGIPAYAPLLFATQLVDLKPKSE